MLKEFIEKKISEGFKDKALCYFIGENRSILMKFVKKDSKFVVFDKKVYSLKSKEKYLMEYRPIPHFIPVYVPFYQIKVDYIDTRSWYRKLWELIPNLNEGVR